MAPPSRGTRRGRGRPQLSEAGFLLTAGPLRELADLASREVNRHTPHFLIIDEINRANLAKAPTPPANVTAPLRQMTG